MTNSDLNKIYNEVMNKLTSERENLIQELSNQQSSFQSSSKSLNELNLKRILCLKQLNENKLISMRFKREIEIKRKFLEGVNKIQVPLFNEEIETDFKEINNKILELNELSNKLNNAYGTLEKDRIKIVIDKLLP